MCQSAGVRLVPDRSFPAYAYVPGESPHPTKDPAGHSFGDDASADPLAFEWGVDLYEHGYFWEAHEAWEPLWRSSDGSERELLAGLIQCAASCLKVRVGERRGARRLGERAVGHLRGVGGVVRGVDAATLAEALEAWLARAPEDLEARPQIAWAC